MAEKKNLIGQKFGKLTVLEQTQKPPNAKGTNAWWKCECSCENKTITVLSTNKLTTGNTTSCGCRKFEARTEEEREAMGRGLRKNDPMITSANRILAAYKRQDPLCTITPKEFMHISQLACSYCGILQDNCYNYFDTKKGATKFAKNNGNFKYNGMDRVDNNLPHIMSNVVPCCIACNRFKGTRTVKETIDHVCDLKILILSYPIFLTNSDIGPMPINNYVVQSLKFVYKDYKDNDKKKKRPFPFEITIEQLHHLSQMPCYYCNHVNTNSRNGPLTDKKSSQKAKEQGWFHFNGIDRVDNTKGHCLDNCVSACIYCNWAKGNKPFDEFMTWIARIKAFNKV